MRRDQARPGARRVPSYALILFTFVLLLGLGFIAMQSGTIDALNAASFFGR